MAKIDTKLSLLALAFIITLPTGGRAMNLLYTGQARTRLYNYESLRLDGAAWTIEALEVRHAGVTGSLMLNPDRSVDVTLDGRASGTATARGRVILDPLSDPRLDFVK